jgi:hypothetical protein
MGFPKNLDQSILFELTIWIAETFQKSEKMADPVLLDNVTTSLDHFIKKRNLIFL